MMKTYEVTITETLQMTVPSRAGSHEEAEEIVRKGWKDGRYVLDASYFQEVNFRAEEQIRVREQE